MGYFSNLDIDRQNVEAMGGVIPDQSLEPDYSDYANYVKSCMADPEFAKEMDKLTNAIRKDISGE